MLRRFEKALRGGEKRKRLLKVQEHVDSAFNFVGLEPVAHFIVVNRQVLENFRRMRLKLGEKFLVLGFIEQLALWNRPCVTQMFFGVAGESGDGHGTEM